MNSSSSVRHLARITFFFGLLVAAFSAHGVQNLVGTPIVDVQARTHTGALASFDDYRGKALIVQVCAMWCGPCQDFTRDHQALSDLIAAELGVNSFQIVDVLFQDFNGSHATQSDALLWRDSLGTTR